MDKKRFGFWFLVAVFIFVVVLFVKSEAQVFVATGNNLDTDAGTVITAEATEATLSYDDTVGNPQTTLEAPADLETTVAAEYGFSGIGAPIDQGIQANQTKFYDYAVTNEGNASDVYTYSYSVTYGNGASGWTVQLVRGGTTDEVTTEATVAEDGHAFFRVKVVAPVDALDTHYVNVLVTAETGEPIFGQYTGANAFTYGGIGTANDLTSTEVSGPVLTLTREVVVDAPTGHISNGGNATDPVPGAVISYKYEYSNTGGASAESNIIVDKVPNDTEGSHVNAGASDVSNVTLTVGQSSATGWIVSTSEAASPDKAYGATAGWTQIGTIDGTGDWATTTGNNGNFTDGISSTTTYIKFEKQYIAEADDNETLIWGVSIR